MSATLLLVISNCSLCVCAPSVHLSSVCFRYAAQQICPPSLHHPFSAGCPFAVYYLFAIRMLAGCYLYIIYLLFVHYYSSVCRLFTVHMSLFVRLLPISRSVHSTIDGYFHLSIYLSVDASIISSVCQKKCSSLCICFC